MQPASQPASRIPDVHVLPQYQSSTQLDGNKQQSGQQAHRPTDRFTGMELTTRANNKHLQLDPYCTRLSSIHVTHHSGQAGTTACLHGVKHGLAAPIRSFNPHSQHSTRLYHHHHHCKNRSRPIRPLFPHNN